MIKFLSLFNLELKKQVGNTKKIAKYRYLYLLVLAIPATVMCYRHSGRLDISLDQASALGLSILVTLSLIQVVMVCFFGPVFSSESVSSERLSGNLDLLRITAGEKNIIFGKFQAGIYLGFLLVTSSFPVITAAYFLGGVTLQQVLATFSIIIITLLLMNAVGLFFSTIFNKSKHATSLFLVLYLFYCMASFDGFSSWAAGNAPRALYDIIRHNNYSLFWHFTVLAILAAATVLHLSVMALKKEFVITLKSLLRIFREPRRPPGTPAEPAALPPSAPSPQAAPPPSTAESAAVAPRAENVARPPKKTVPDIRRPHSFTLCGYFNPVLVKGLPFFPLRGMKQLGMVVLIIMYVFLVLAFITQAHNLEELGPMFFLMPVLSVIVAGYSGAAAFADEKKAQLMELFRLISLPSRTVVMGKILSSMTLAALCLLYAALGALFVLLTRPHPLALVAILLMALAMVYPFFYACLGVFLSLICRKERTARSLVIFIPMLFACLGCWSAFLPASPFYIILVCITVLFLFRMPSLVAVPRLRKRTRSILRGLGLVVMISFAACLASGAVMHVSVFHLFQMVTLGPAAVLLVPLIDSIAETMGVIFLLLCSVLIHVLFSWFLFTIMQSILESDLEWNGKTLLKALWRGRL